MYQTNETSSTILVVEDIQETREGIERLLSVDGYRVNPAKDEQHGIESAKQQRPNLILVSLGGPLRDVLVSARRIREAAGIGDDVPLVIFCIDEIAEGDEVAIDENVHMTRPDNFDQLRKLLARLLSSDH
jgi:CheY-like chemotaxis protein